MADLNSKDSSRPIKIIGRDEVHEADVVDESGRKRLAVTGLFTPVADPNNPKINLHGTVLNSSGNDDMAIDGSSTPVEFKFEPAAGELWFLKQIGCLLGAGGDPDHDQFGDLPALTNGLKFEIQSDGTIYNPWNGANATIKKNIELTAFFSDQTVVGLTDSKWFKDSGGRYYIGHINYLNDPWVLDGDQSDILKVTVQDDLTGLIFLNTTFHAWRFA